MRILAIHPGAHTSTSDVYDGLIPALRAFGHDVLEYPLHQRITRVASWLEYSYKRAKKTDPDVARPTFRDTLYLAGERALPIALLANVDWVLILSGMYLLKQWLVLMQRAGLRVGVAFSESPYDDDEQIQFAPYADVVWTNERLSVASMRLVQPESYYLPHAFDPLKHRPGVEDGDDVPAHDVVFVGTGFPDRVEMLSAVNWDGIDLGLYGNWECLERTQDRDSRGRFHGTFTEHPLRKFVRAKQIPDTLAAALYRRAKIGLNLYRKSKGFEPNATRIDAAESLNPRAVELAACGAFHLSDYRAEVKEVFGELVPTFGDAEELEGLIRSWLARPAERAALAAQLPGAVADRTFATMARRLLVNLQRIGAHEAVPV